MCGGDLNITAEEKIIECEYCGSTQTVPDGSDEKKTNLFNRANRLRMDNEFDKASGVYESIVSEFPEEAEGYWGLVLCSYGIEYVDDAKTGKKIPTCHRTLTSSVMDDDNFTQACENADVVARGIYREEAKAIDKLQQQIIAVVENEEPYDVFICYKETDDITKSRTEDSLIAQDIYTELIKEGYKVFFSRVTLRDKAGTEYEPYIYAALKSAKIMLAIGTKFDYYDAVWVKNEWSRYISMMADDSSKHLIPCFKNLDAYDIPKEFKNLQALDMGEVTFFKNLTDNVERFMPKQTTEQPKVVEIQSDFNSATIDSLLKRAFMFLEDGNWKSAEEYCEKVLDIDPECDRAYLGKLMVNLKVYTQEELENYNKAFYIDNNYQKFIKYSDDEKLKTKLQEINQRIIDESVAEDTENFYNEGITLMQESSVSSLGKAINIFKQILDWKDAEKFCEECKAKLDEKQKELKNAIQSHAIRSNQMYLAYGCHRSLAVKKDGTITMTKLIRKANQETKIDISNWSDIIGLCASTSFMLGLKTDGTVVATGENEDGQCNVSKWSDIIAIDTGTFHSVGLKTDGTVVAVGSNSWEQCDVSISSVWQNVVAISAGDDHTVALKSNGTVVATGYNEDGQCEVWDWTDVIYVSAKFNRTIGLKLDGTVVATGYNEDGQCDVADWTDIVAVSAGSHHTVGLKSDGTVVAVGDNEEGQCNVYDWTDIVAISAGYGCTIGLKSDGTVIATGDNECGQCDVSAWSDVVAIYCACEHTLGLKSNGTVVATKYKDPSLLKYYGECKVSHFEDIMLPIYVNTLEELYAEIKKIRQECEMKKEKIRQEKLKLNEEKRRQKADRNQCRG